MARCFIALALVSVNLMACCCGGVATPEKGADEPPAFTTPDSLRERFGKPDKDVSAENENPRPLMLTRQLVYDKQNVRVFFIPEDTHRGNDVPVRGWQLLQFQDAKTNEVISIKEGYRRLAQREEKKEP